MESIVELRGEGGWGARGRGGGGAVEAADSESDSSISSEGDGGGWGADPAESMREKPVRDIWLAEEINQSLRRLPGAEEIIGLMELGLDDELMQHPCAASALLWASWSGKLCVLTAILNRGAVPVDVADEEGRNGLHLSCIVGSEACAAQLLSHGADPNSWDVQRKATPLHCAASAKSLPCIKLLVRCGADVNAGLSERSPLHYAVLSDALDCVKELLDCGSCPDTPQVFTETPLHVAAALGSAGCVSLLLGAGADARAACGPARATALHIAAADGHAECVRQLLDAGAYTDCRNSRMQTPMHLASLAQSPECVEALAGRGGDANAGDADGRAPLHCAVAKAARACDTARALLDRGADPNRRDAYGYTPLHIAALNEFAACLALLLDYGGDVTLRTNGGVSVLSFIVRRTPEVIPKYIERFDASIKRTDHELGDVDCELKLDFRVLVPSVGRGETELMLAFIEVGRKDVLKHPLCETFLFLKWRRIRKFFIFSLTYHAIFVLLFSIYVIEVYLHDCPAFALLKNDKVNCSTTEIPKTETECTFSPQVIIIGYMMIVINLCLLIKEVFQAFHNWNNYIKEWENWLQWFIIIGVFLCTIPPVENRIKRASMTWQYDVAACAIFFSWLELMMIVGRFPMFGLYVQMFTTVAVNFSKFLMAYSCLLVAFGLAFCVLFANYPSFTNITKGLIKTVMMMSGELEYEDIFYNNVEDYPIIFPVTGQIFFLAFTLLVTVILTNLLVGLAVSDIQALQESAGLDRLVRQAELVAHLESMLFSPLLRCAPRTVLAVCRRAAMLLASPYHCLLSIRPNDPRETRIPKDLIASIYKLVATRKDDKKAPRSEYVFGLMEKQDTSAKRGYCSRYSYHRNFYANQYEKRKRTTSNNADNRMRPVSCFSAIQDYTISDIKNQVTEINRKLDRWHESIDAKLQLLEDKFTRR